MRTYRRYLLKAGAGRDDRSALLEIGCGDGFMLLEALRLGFSSVAGIEPSEEAVSHAVPEVAPCIIRDVLGPDLLLPQTFDVVCLFQVLDHLPDPLMALHLCRAALKPGGAILILNHNVEALSARLLRERSPIIDVEHTYLYGPRTLSSSCRAAGLVVEQVGPVWNWCSLGYLAQLLPLPARLKEAVLTTLRRSRLGMTALPLPLGNLYVIARKTP